jgi:hypothetical protein
MFDMDSTYIYSTNSDGIGINLTPKAGGVTITFFDGATNELLVAGNNLYWGELNDADYIYSSPLSNGSSVAHFYAIDGIVDGTATKTAFTENSSNIFWANAQGTGACEIAWYNAPLYTVEATLPSSATAYVESMVSDGTNVYYSETSNSCSSSDSSPAFTLKRVPILGGTPSIVSSSICGNYTLLAVDALNVYFLQQAYSTSTPNGIYSYATSGASSSPVQITQDLVGNAASDGKYLYICSAPLVSSGSYLYKVPVTGAMPGTGVTPAILNTSGGLCLFGPVKLDSTCVYYVGGSEGGVWTVNKSP